MSRTALLERLFSCEDPDLLFHGGDRAIIPWSRAARSPDRRSSDHRADRTHQRAAVATASLAATLRQPVRLVAIDPRELLASQPRVVRHHLRYYLTGEWERTGTTSADMAKVSNRFPLIELAGDGRKIIRTGHHRSLAALIQGRRVLCRVCPAAESPPNNRGQSHRADGPTSEHSLDVTVPIAITAHLRLDRGAIPPLDLHHSRVGGELHTVASEDDATIQLITEGLDPRQVEDRLSVAHGGPTLVDR